MKSTTSKRALMSLAAVAVIGGSIFAVRHGGNDATLAGQAVGQAETSFVGETGRVELSSTIDDGISQTITLRNTYQDPVVVAFINSRNGNQSVQARVRSVTGNSFEIFMQEPDNQGHTAETVSYIVVEKGRHILDGGLIVEAGSVDTATVHVGGSSFLGDSVSFQSSFSSAPAVLHSLNSFNSGDFMASFVGNVGAGGFEIGLEAAESGKAAVAESIAYIAFETGTGTTNGVPFDIGASDDGSSDGVGQAAHAISLSGFEAAPDIVVSSYGENGADGAWARGAGTFSATSQTVFAEEDQVKDSERGHANETFAYAAFAADTDLITSGLSTKWRLRNAAVPSSGQWAFRELKFCLDAACEQPVSGTAIDSGNAMDWAPAANAFDGDTDTMWKTTDADVAGQSYIGLEFDSPVEIAGVYLKTDNVVYHSEDMYLEYYDDDAQAWVTADYLKDLADNTELTEATSVRSTFPVAWRLRNADVPSSGQWVIREMDFCADAACASPLSGTAIDSGDSRDWSLPANAFDGDTDTLWKSFDADVAGQSYLGLEFDRVTDVAGLYVKTDNSVYSPTAVFVEYYDAVSQAWVTADYIGGMPAADEVNSNVTLRDSFPIKWRVRNADVPSSGQWVIREMDFCSDADCANPVSGTAFDSGDSRDWSLPANAFDGDTDTLWKTFDADVAGQSYLGLEFETVTEINGLYMQTDNSVYAPTALFIEYYDAVSGEWVTSDYLGGMAAQSDVNHQVEQRDRFPTAWRLRNVDVPSSSQWAIREMDFCSDADCANPLSGTAIDSGSAMDWAPAANAFDDDTSTMWKTTDADVAGQSYLGLQFETVTEAAGLYIKTDNSVYSPTGVYVEYYDVVSGAWETASTLSDMAAQSELNFSL